MKPTAGVIEQLRAHHGRLTGKFRLLADFVAEHYRRVAFMSARELAREAGVSLPTVVRFVARVGYDGYQSFNRAIQERVNVELTAVERLESVLHQRGSEPLYSEVISRDLQALKQLQTTFPAKELRALTPRVAHADAVFVVGVRYVMPLTTYLTYTLRRLRPAVLGFTEIDSTVYDELALQPRDTLVVVIGFARYPNELIDFVEFARNRRFEVAVLTDQALSPLATLGDHVLVVPVPPMRLMRSMAAPAALLNILVLEVARALGQKGMERMETLEEVAIGRGTYFGNMSRNFREVFAVRPSPPRWRGQQSPRAASRPRRRS